MALNVTEAQINEIVQQVVRRMQADTPAQAEPAWDATQYHGRRFIGIYSDMNEAIEAASRGYKAIRDMSVEEREKIITSIRGLIRKEARIMAEIGVAETGMGRVEHKEAKHLLVADKTPGTEDITSVAKTGDNGLTLVEMAPFGVVGAITPSTNPSETVLCNSIGMIAAGNGVVFNPHPHAIATSNYAVDLVNRACHAAGGPEVLVCSMDKPTMESAAIMQSHPLIRLLVCTGGLSYPLTGSTGDVLRQKGDRRRRRQSAGHRRRHRRYPQGGQGHHRRLYLRQQPALHRGKGGFRVRQHRG